jgi:biopolymer transport protein TolR
MASRSRRSGKRTILAEINVVPYIDVMLVLLVIFMITAPLMTQGIKVNLPKAAASAINLKKETPVIVSVDKMGRYYANISPTPTVPVMANQLVNLVAADIMLARQKNQTLPVFVKGDKEVDYGQVVGAMVLLQKAGAGSVGLLTKNPPKEGANA